MWLDEYTWETWWQVLTSNIGAGCNTGRSLGYLKMRFWSRSWYDWRATSVLRTGGRQSYGAGNSTQLLEARPLTTVLTNVSHPSRHPTPAHTVLNSKWKTNKDRIQKEKNVRKEKDRNLKREEKTKVNNEKGRWERRFRFQNFKAPS